MLHLREHYSISLFKLLMNTFPLTKFQQRGNIKKTIHAGNSNKNVVMHDYICIMKLN